MISSFLDKFTDIEDLRYYINYYVSIVDNVLFLFAHLI